MKIKMSENYGRLEAGVDYRVDDTTAKSLVTMGKAVIVPDKKKKRIKPKPSVIAEAVAPIEESADVEA